MRSKKYKRFKKSSKLHRTKRRTTKRHTTKRHTTKRRTTKRRNSKKKNMYLHGGVSDDININDRIKQLFNITSEEELKDKSKDELKKIRELTEADYKEMVFTPIIMGLYHLMGRKLETEDLIKMEKLFPYLTSDVKTDLKKDIITIGREILILKHLQSSKKILNNHHHRYRKFSDQLPQTSTDPKNEKYLNLLLSSHVARFIMYYLIKANKLNTKFKLYNIQDIGDKYTEKDIIDPVSIHLEVSGDYKTFQEYLDKLELEIEQKKTVSTKKTPEESHLDSIINSHFKPICLTEKASRDIIIALGDSSKKSSLLTAYKFKDDPQEKTIIEKMKSYTHHKQKQIKHAITVALSSYFAKKIKSLHKRSPDQRPIEIDILQKRFETMDEHITNKNQSSKRFKRQSPTIRKAYSVS